MARFSTIGSITNATINIRYSYGGFNKLFEVTRLLYYLPNKKMTSALMSATELEKYIGELEKENKKLRERVEELEGERSRDGLLGQATMEEAYNRITELEEENKKLNDKIDLLEEEIIILKEKKGNLKSELSKYKKYYDRDKEELMESCYSLAKENDELKKQIENLNGIAKMLI